MKTKAKNPKMAIKQTQRFGFSDKDRFKIGNSWQIKFKRFQIFQNIFYVLAKNDHNMKNNQAVNNQQKRNQYCTSASCCTSA